MMETERKQKRISPSFNHTSNFNNLRQDKQMGTLDNVGLLKRPTFPPWEYEWFLRNTFLKKR